MVVYELIICLAYIALIIFSAIDIRRKYKEHGHSWYWHINKFTFIGIVSVCLLIFAAVFLVVAIYIFPLIEKVIHYKIF